MPACLGMGVEFYEVFANLTVKIQFQKLEECFPVPTDSTLALVLLSFSLEVYFVTMKVTRVVFSEQ